MRFSLPFSGSCPGVSPVLADVGFAIFFDENELIYVPGMKMAEGDAVGVIAAGEDESYEESGNCINPFDWNVHSDFNLH